MKNFKKMMENNWAAYTLATCSAVLLFVFLSNFSSFMNIVYSIEGLLFPIIIGAVLAYLLNPVVIFFEERALKKVKKDSLRYNISVIFAVLVFVALLVILVIAFSAYMAQNPDYFDQLMGSYTNLYGSGQ